MSPKITYISYRLTKYSLGGNLDFEIGWKST